MMLRILGVFLLLATTLCAALPDEQEIAKLYARGLAGDAQAVIDCISKLEQVLAARPEDQRARAYLGSAEALRSRDLPLGIAKWKTLQKGLAHMDEAAAAAPENARVQLLRAMTNEALPALLGRRKIARDALEQLVAAVEKDPAKLSPHDRQLLYLNAGEAADKAGDAARAKTLWERGAAIEGDAGFRAELQAKLQPPTK